MPLARRSLTNFFNNQTGQIIPPPGITELNTTGGVARGQFVWQDALYQVVSTDLIKITDTTTGAFIVIGTIAGDAIVDVAIGFNTATIVVLGGNLYTLDVTDTLVDISGNAFIVPSIAVEHIDGRFVYIPEDGSPAYFSDVGAAGTVQSTSFFDAEELPDKNNTVFEFKGTLYIGGTQSFELFRNTGDETTPFRRITGARVSNGFIGGLIEYNETYLFIGREEDQDAGIYALGQGIALKISNQVIDLILTNQTESQLADTRISRFKWRGFDIATFSGAGGTIAFFGGEWFFMNSIDDKDNVGLWGGGFINQFEGSYYTSFQDKIGRLDKVNSDYGNKIVRTIDTAFHDPDNGFFVCQNIELGASQGALSEPASVGLFMSRNNVEYSDGYFRDLGALGEYATHLEWNLPGGMGSYNGFMGIRIYTTDIVSFMSNTMVANFR